MKFLSNSRKEVIISIAAYNPNTYKRREGVIMKRVNWLFVILLYLSIACFLSTARAEEQIKGVPAKAAPTKAVQAKAVPTKAVPTKTAQANAAPHKQNTPQGHRGEEHHNAEHRDGHRADIHHFNGHNYQHWNERERAIWRGGVWRQEEFNGRFGYWWVVGGKRYFYERPVYPYPRVAPEIVYELPVEQVVVQQSVHSILRSIWSGRP
jgi:hypothetical protein